MKPPVNRAFTIGRGHQGIDAMNQAVSRAKIADDFRRPRPARLPCDPEWLRPDLLKETGEILDVRADCLERRRALEKYDAGPNRVSDLKRLYPRLPHLVAILKRSEARASFGIYRSPQAAVGRTRL